MHVLGRVWADSGYRREGIALYTHRLELDGLGYKTGRTDNFRYNLWRVDASGDVAESVLYGHYISISCLLKLAPLFQHRS